MLWTGQRLLWLEPGEGRQRGEKEHVGCMGLGGSQKMFGFLFLVFLALSFGELKVGGE